MTAAPKRAHALLGPSSSITWTTCTPSAKLNAEVEEKPSSAADRGTFGHKMIEHCIHTGVKTADLVGLPTWESNEFFTLDLRDDSQFCVDFARALIAEVKAQCPDAVVATEIEVDLRRWIPEGFGTSDLIIVADDTLIVVDWKMGRERVKAKGNPQPRCYGLGAYEHFSHLYDIKRVRMIIVQPAIDHIDEDTVGIEDLLEWGEWLRTRAELAWKGEGEFCPSEKACRWCKVRVTCRARAEANLELAKHDFAPAHQLTPEEIAEILPKLDELKKWADQIQEYSLEQALNGVKFPGWKLAAGRTTRRITNQEQAKSILTSAGYDEDQILEAPQERSLLGLTALEKLVGKKRFSELLEGLLTKSDPKPVLVPASDKREEFNPRAAAAADFQ